ncbi:hypothetical protein EJ131_25225 [Bacillus mycoides]|uniref:hypothetical protein n=1 Tax=Bacillus mycoides TaxID=1405 RepID=UPI0022B338A3|nr:hypothetical protein [Bacillus mycoides]MCZ6943753.1 hypothetical protein [Bacillus mycoides]
MATNESNDPENGLIPLDIDMIDTEGTTEGITVIIPSYPDMQPGDIIEVYWNGRTIDYTIDKDEVNNEIEIQVPFADVKKIKNRSVPGYYRITDIVGNTSKPRE